MLKYKKEVIPLYSGGSNSCVHLIIADKKDWQKGIDLLNKFNDHYEPCYSYEEVSAFYTTTCKNGVNHFWIMFKPKQISMNTISHEIVHVVNGIFSSRYIKLDLHNDEPQAYLTGWVTEIVTKFCKNYIKL